jgi:hypothetical protein
VHERAEAVPKDFLGVIEELALHRIVTSFVQGVPPLALAFVPAPRRLNNVVANLFCPIAAGSVPRRQKLVNRTPG